MTVPPINLTALRAAAEATDGRRPTTCLVDPYVLLALIDTAEAAQALDLKTIDSALGWLYNETGEDTTEADDQLERLRESLARYTQTP